MGVFLRWGIFGILAVAALVYAYHALGHLAERRQSMPAAVVAPEARESEQTPQARESKQMPQARESEQIPAAQDASAVAAPADRDVVPRKCALDLDIARRAVESRSVGEPLDRLLRIQEIAW